MAAPKQTTVSTEKLIYKNGADKLPKSKLDTGLQALVSLIFDMNLIEKSVLKSGYDPVKLPLGELS